MNDVRLRILDDSGQERFIDFSGFFAAQLLDTGLSEFSFAAGVRSNISVNGGFDYSDDYIATGFYRWGATRNFTPEIGAQISEDVQVLNIGGVIGSEFGALDVAVAGSTSDDDGTGWAASARLTSAFNFGEDVARFDLAAFASSEDYRTVEQQGPQATEFEVSGRVGVPLPFDAFGSVGLRYTEFRDTGDDLVLGVSVNRAFGPFSVFATADFGLRGQFESRALLTITTRFGAQGAARATVNPFDGSGAVEIVNQPRQFAGDFGYRVNLQRNNGGTGQGVVEGSYRGNRFEALVSQRFDTRDEFTGVDASTTFASVGTSVVFADGDVALSRPVFESFAIVKKHPSLKDSEVITDEVDGRFTSRTDALGPAVVNDLNSYIRRDLRLDILDRPVGYTLEDERPTLFPGLVDGYSITVGDDAYITLISILTDAHGNPLASRGGEAIYLDGDPDEDIEPIDLFTTSSGRTVLLRLRPGRYRLRLFGSDREAVIEINDDDGALQRRPTIIMETPDAVR